MDTFFLIYLASLSLLVFMTMVLSTWAFLHWRLPGARTLGFLMASLTIWAGFYVIEITHPALEVKYFARKMLYFGMVMSPPFWLGFALRYTGIGAWWSDHGRVFLLAIPGTFAFILGLTNEWHHLIWRSVSLAKEPVAPLILEFGFGFWVFALLSYVLIIAGFVIYIISYIKSGQMFRVRTGVILAGTALTSILNIGFFFINDTRNLDPTPLSFALSAPLIAFGFFRFGVSTLFPLAASLVVENLRDAILVVNNDDLVSDVNQAAIKLLGVVEKQRAIPVFSILPEPDRFRKIWNTPNSNLQVEVARSGVNSVYDVQVIPIRHDAKTFIGRVVIFHDVTNEQNLLKAEKRRSQLLFLLEETGRRIADSFDEDEILKRTVDAIIQQFGYPMAAISKLTAEDMLEVFVISATEDFGYQPGYKQPFGSGIIGYTASLKKTYIARNVSEDKHYYSTSKRSGSAICTPIFKRGGAVFGTLYIESYELGAFNELDAVTLETLASQVSESLERAALYARTQQNLLTLTTIQNISKLIVSSLDITTISQTVVKSLKEAFQYTHVSIYFLSEDYLHLTAQVGYPEERVLNKIHISQGVAGRAVRTRDVQFIEDTSQEDVFLQADQHLRSEICVPLLKDGHVLGILNVEAGEHNQLTQMDVDLLVTIASPISVAMDNARLHAELKQMATTDAVTGLSNRHVFEQALQAEIERAERTGAPLCLIIFDIDFFKEYNDKWGHPAGDARLKALAGVVKRTLRKYDIAARYGGDEFAIILSDCTTDNALTFAQRIQMGAREGAPEPIQEEIGLSGHTLSIGIAAYPQDATSPAELLIAADHAAMRAKQQGRNRIKLANEYETH